MANGIAGRTSTTAALGSAENAECRIDSLPQKLGGDFRGGRSRRADAGDDALDSQLVNRDLRLIKLLDPPFDQSD